MYFYNRKNTINKMTTGNQNFYLFNIQTLNFVGCIAQCGNKSQWVVVIPQLATRLKRTPCEIIFKFIRFEK